MEQNSNTNPRVYPLISISIIQNPSRLWAIPILGGVIKMFILIPVFLELWALYMIIFILSPINAFVVLFTGKFWTSLYDLIVGTTKLSLKSAFFAHGLTNKYPGFIFNINDSFSVDVKYPQSSNRLYAIPFIGILIRQILIIPFVFWAGIVLYGASLGVAFAASFYVLFTGKYPESVFELVKDVMRMYHAQILYLLGVSDTYPSFSISWNHKGKKILLFILAILIFLLQMGSSAANSTRTKQYNYNYTETSLP